MTTSTNILQSEAWSNIQSVINISVPDEHENIKPSDKTYQIAPNTPITASYLHDTYNSFFKDDIWIISEAHQLNFNSGIENLSASEIMEIKVISYLFLEIPVPCSQGLYKTRLAPKTVHIRVSTLKALKKTSTLKSQPLLSLFSDINVANNLAKEIHLAEKNNTTGFSLIVANLKGLITHIKHLSLNYLNIKAAYSEQLNEVLNITYTKARNSSKQHTIIPPIIYAKIYTDAINIIDKWDSKKFEDDKKQLLDAYNNLNSTGSNNKKKAGITRKAYQNRLNDFLTHKDNIYERAGNFEFFKDKIKSVGQVNVSSFFYGVKNVTGITYEIRRIQAFLDRLILQESGMRENELIHLLNEPEKIISTPKGTVFQILGKETKISKGKRTGWVVSKNGVNAHNILRQLSDFSYEMQIASTFTSCWLFPELACAIADKGSKGEITPWTTPDGRTAYIKAPKEKPISIESLFKAQELDDNKKSKRIDRTGNYNLTDADVNFLHKYSSPLNKLNDDVLPNQHFTITEHQFRRSLAFYVSGSGLLSISDLKHQLKHTALITSLYYAEGGKALQQSGLLLDDDTYSEMSQYAIKNLEQTDTISRKELINIVDESRATLFGPGLIAVKQFTESIKHSENPDK
jgi:integrase